MNPRARKDIQIAQNPEGQRVAIFGDRSWQLSATAAWVLTKSDGETQLDQLLCDETHGPQVWTALDELADAGLLVERLSPPAGGSARHVIPSLTRREAFGRAAATLLTAAGVGIALRAGVAHAEGEELAPATADETAETTRLETEKRRLDEKHAKRKESLRNCKQSENDRKSQKDPDCKKAEGGLERVRVKEEAAKSQLKAHRHRERAAKRRRFRKVHQESAKKR